MAISSDENKLLMELVGFARNNPKLWTENGIVKEMMTFLDAVELTVEQIDTLKDLLNEIVGLYTKEDSPEIWDLSEDTKKGMEDAWLTIPEKVDLSTGSDNEHRFESNPYFERNGCKVHLYDHNKPVPIQTIILEARGMAEDGSEILYSFR